MPRPSPVSAPSPSFQQKVTLPGGMQRGGPSYCTYYAKKRDMLNCAAIKNWKREDSRSGETRFGGGWNLLADYLVIHLAYAELHKCVPVLLVEVVFV